MDTEQKYRKYATSLGKKGVEVDVWRNIGETNGDKERITCGQHGNKKKRGRPKQRLLNKAENMLRMIGATRWKVRAKKKEKVERDCTAIYNLFCSRKEYNRV